MAFSDDPEALVFTNTEGVPIRYDNWRRRVWLPAIQPAGCEVAGFHDLRRLAAVSPVLARVSTISGPLASVRCHVRSRHG